MGVALEYPPADLEALRERGEAVGGRLACRGDGVHHERCARDDAERPFGADEELREVRSDGLSWRVAAEFNHVAVGEHDGQTPHNVFDLAIAVGKLSGASTGDPSADGRELEGLRKVTDRPTNVAHGLFQLRSEDSRVDAHESRHRVDPADDVESGHVERNRARRGERAADDTRTSTLRRDGDLVRGGAGEYAAHLFGRRGPHDNARPRRHQSPRDVANGERPPVASCCARAASFVSYSILAASRSSSSAPRSGSGMGPTTPLAG